MGRLVRTLGGQAFGSGQQAELTHGSNIMAARPLWFASLFLMALSLGASWSHILQIRGKAGWGGPMWRTVMETLYRDYATLGAVTEIGAILAAWVLVVALWRRGQPGRGWALAGALLASFAFFGLWIGMIAPTNAILATWTPATMPADWVRWRDSWELWHAVIAGVKALAFGALILGVLSRSPEIGRDQAPVG